MVNVRAINLMCLVVTSILLQRTWSPPGLCLPKKIEDMHLCNPNLIGKEIDIHFLSLNREIIHYKLNYHDQKIRQALHATYRTTGQLFQPCWVSSAVFTMISPIGEGEKNLFFFFFFSSIMNIHKNRI